MLTDSQIQAALDSVEFAVDYDVITTTSLKRGVTKTKTVIEITCADWYGEVVMNAYNSSRMTRTYISKSCAGNTANRIVKEDDYSSFDEYHNEWKVAKAQIEDRMKEILDEVLTLNSISV